MIIYLMKHGQTDWDLNGRILSWKDVPLNQTGILQVQKAAGKLKNIDLATIYSSDLKCAKKTADIISAALDLPVHYTKRLREMNFGKASGVKKSDLEAKFPHIFPAFNDIKNPERYAVAYPEGETIGEVQQRFIKFISRLNEEKHTNVLLITHGMLIRMFAETCLKKNISLENASLLKVSYDEKNKKFRTPKILF